MPKGHARAKSLTIEFFDHDESKEKEEREKEKEIGKSYSFVSRSSEKPDHQIISSLGDINEAEESEEVGSDQQINLDQLSNDVDKFINSLSSGNYDAKAIETQVSPKVIKYLKKLEVEIDVYESEENSLTFGQNPKRDSDLIESISRVSAIHGVLNGLSRSHHETMPLFNETSVVLHRSMVFLEEELRLLLDEPMDRNSSSSNSKHRDSSLKNLKGRLQSFAVHSESGIGGGGGDLNEKSEVGEEGNEAIPFPSFTREILGNIGLISNAMISSGYESECCNIFAVARRHAFEEELKKLGFDKVSVDDIQKMNWEPLEGEIVSWIRVFKHCFSDLIPREQRLYKSILSNYPIIYQSLLGDLVCGVFSVVLNFAEAIAMTKRSTEKLFKFLDIYETIRDSIPSIEDNKVEYPKQCVEELREQLSFAQMMLGEAAVSIFCQLENSIKADSNKTPVPNGAVHPLTRYMMNYIEYACEYKDSLEEVFQKHLKIEQDDEEHNLTLHHAHKEPKHHHKVSSGSGGEDDEKKSPYASQLMTIMDLLDQNLDAKSKLYKDLSLRYIFLMNNGRYMLQKARGSAEINQVVGDNWIRKRSSDVRNYHKNYQRETWTKVLQCLNHEGLQVHGKVYKPYLKERFKNFNQLFDEIHKTQSMWVVSDEQLQSELRVSISAVMIPAYRSFVARFGQIFTPGRQVEKYIKFQPEDIEAAVEDLFDGNAASMAKRR